MADDILREWRPGDGLRCTYHTRAPQGIPCGPPIKTWVSTQVSVRRSGRTTVARPVCANHTERGASMPSKMRAEADRIARERLIHAHWGEYEKYLAEATAWVVAQRKEASDG